MNSAAVFSFTCPVKINSGNRALEHLPFELAGLNASKPLVVVNAKAAGPKAVRTLLAAFGDSGMTPGLFEGVSEATDLGVVDHLKNLCLEKKYDAFIALGGGKAPDIAKVLNLAVSLKTPDARRLSPETPLRHRLMPLAVVPTEGADGLETSQIACVGRMVFSGERLAPALAVLDFRLAKGKSRIRTAATGLAALGRAAEAHIQADQNPFRKAYSFAALRFVRENLMDAVADPGNPKAALALMNAAAMSGCAFSNASAGRLHKLGQVFYEFLGIPQGVIMGMCLPRVLEDEFRQSSGDPAALLQPLAGDEAFARTPAEKRSGEALSALKQFLAALRGSLGKELPQNLREAGVSGFRREEVLDLLRKDEDGPYLCGVVEWMTDGDRERNG